ncbi:hypothetical protein D9M70_542650 [compost metagenome]
MVGLDPDTFEVGVLDDDVFFVFVFVTLDQVRALDEAEFRVDRFHIDPVVGVLVKLIEADAFARAGRRIEPHGATDETEFEVTFPTCPGRHDCLLRGQTHYVLVSDRSGKSLAKSSISAQGSPKVSRSPGSEE